MSERVAGRTPDSVTTLRATAYTSAPPYYTSTASGARASSYYTLAGRPDLPFGTIIYIPYFANVNGGYFIVQDRGGAINGVRTDLDVYLDSESECRSFGRRALTGCEIYYP